MQKYQPEELALLFKRLFNTDDGKQVYHVLKERFRKPPILPTQLTDGNAIAPLTFMRVGEENVVRYIENLIERKFDNE